MDAEHVNANSLTIPMSSVENSTLSYSEESQSRGYQGVPPEAIIIPIIFSLMVVLGGLGNLLVMIVVLRNRDHFRNTTNLFILNLAAADLLFLVFCAPFHAVMYIGLGWPFGQFMCKFVHFVQYASMIASILTLVTMSFDRYLAVGYPLRTKHMRTPRKALFIAIVVWVISIIMASPLPIVYTVRVYNVPICADDWAEVAANKAIYFLILFIFGYATPLVTISILSILMVRQLWLVDEYRCQGTRTLETIKAKRKVTRLVIVIVAVFLVCWLPSHVTWLWTNYFSTSWRKTYVFYYMKIFAHVLSYANSAMNPVIYAFLSQNFRKGFKKALLCRYKSTSLRAIPMTRTMSHDDRVLPVTSFADFNMKYDQ